MDETERTTELNPERPENGDEQALAAWLAAGFQVGLEARKPFERAALTCLQFWAGDQWGDYYADPINYWRRNEVYPDSCEEVRRTDNQFPTHTRQIISNITDNLPTMVCKPVSYYDPADVTAAGLGNRVLKWQDDLDDEDAKREDDLLWLLAAGETLRRTQHDPKAQDGRGALSTEGTNFFCYVKDPYSVGQQWPPRWLDEYDVRTLDWVREQYGVKVEPQAVGDLSQWLDQLAYNVAFGRTRQARESMKNAVVLHRRYVPPSKRYPEGYCWVWTGEQVLTKHPLQAGRWPFARGGWFPIAGRLYPLSLLELLLPDQRALNVLESQGQESTNAAVRRDVMIAGNMDDLTEKIINPRTGQKRYALADPAAKWEFVEDRTNWQRYQAARDEYKTGMGEKAGMNRPSLGQDVGREVRVGELQIAREADLQGLSWHARRFAQFFLRPIAQQKLALIRQYYRDYRLLTVYGDREAPPVFTGADLRGTADVMTIQRPHMTPAMKQRAEAEAKAEGLTGPYLNPATGQPDLFTQLACRLALRSRGLEDLEEEIAQTYGPLEDLQAVCSQLAETQKETQVAQVLAEGVLAKAQLQGLMNPQPAAPGMPGAQPALTAGQPAMNAPPQQAAVGV